MFTLFQSMWYRNLGPISTIKFEVGLESPTIPPVHLVPNCVGPKASDLEISKIWNRLAITVIEHVQTEWASSVVFARRIDGTVRFGFHYKKRNLLSTRDLYLLPEIDKFVDSLGDAQLFSTFDAKISFSANWSRPIQPWERSVHFSPWAIPIYLYAVWS